MAQLFADAAAHCADAIALVDETGSTTWGALNARTNRLVHALRAAGLRPGDTIALLASNRREFFEVLAAGMHCGLFVLPVNWHWVARELAHVIDDSDAVALFVDERFLDVAAEATHADRSARCRVRIALTDRPPAGFDSYEALVDAAPADEPADQQA